MFYLNIKKECGVEDDLLFFVCQIANCIGYTPGYRYCLNKEDFKVMSVAFVATYQNNYGYRPYAPESFEELQKQINNADEIIGFGTAQFDDRILKENGVEIKTSYDLLEEIGFAAGHPLGYQDLMVEHGYDLNSIAKSNLNILTDSSLQERAKLWQKNKGLDAVTGCFEELKQVVEIYKKRNNLLDPTSGNVLRLRTPRSLLDDFARFPF